jgi:hypothetical protein
MTQDLIFAQDVILDPHTWKIVAVVRNGGVWRDGARIAVLVGVQMYDLNGNLFGKLATGDGSLPVSFKNLIEGKSAEAERAFVAMPALSRSIRPKSSSEQIKLDLVSVTSESERRAQT